MTFTDFRNWLLKQPYDRGIVWETMERILGESRAAQLAIAIHPHRRSGIQAYYGVDLHAAAEEFFHGNPVVNPLFEPLIQKLRERRFVWKASEQDLIEPTTDIRIRPDLVAVDPEGRRVCVDLKLGWTAPSVVPLHTALQIAAGWKARWGKTPAGRNVGQAWYIHPQEATTTIRQIAEVEKLAQVFVRLVGEMSALKAA